MQWFTIDKGGIGLRVILDLYLRRANRRLKIAKDDISLPINSYCILASTKHKMYLHKKSLYYITTSSRYMVKVVP